MKDFDYKCPVQGCCSTYKSMFNLKKHLEIVHIKVKKYYCSICSKSLSSKQNLREHLYIHSGDKPYKCSIPGCGMSFRQGSQLSVHKKNHTDQSMGKISNIIDITHFNRILNEFEYSPKDNGSELSDAGGVIELPMLGNQRMEVQLPSLRVALGNCFN